MIIIIISAALFLVCYSEKNFFYSIILISFAYPKNAAAKNKVS